MASEQEISPIKTPWSDRPFVRSRFIVKRLKRMRSKTHSLHAEIEGSYNPFLHSSEPSSKTFIRSLSMEASNCEEEEYFQCCSQNFSEFHENSGKEDSIRNDSQSKEVNVTFDDESVREMSQRSLTFSILDDNRISTRTLNDDSDADTSSCDSSFETYFKKNDLHNLLEEIEDALPVQYSLIRPLYSFHSVPMYRAISRLNRVLAYHPYEGTNFSSSRNKRKDVGSFFAKEIQRLQVELAVQKMLLDQASKAMTVSTLKKFYQSEHMEAEKAFLLATIKHEAVEKEIERVKIMQVSQNKFDGESGFASIKKITINVEKPGTLSSYYFLLVAVERDNVKNTELHKMMGENVEFDNILQFHNLHHDFKITLHLYAISIKETRLRLFHGSTDRINLLSKRKAFSKQNGAVNSSAKHSFVLLGTTEIEFAHMNQQHFELTSTSEQLSRRISLNIQGDVYLDAHHSGFLDIKHVHQNEKVPMAWSRFWFRLTGTDLQGWQYPQQHTMTPPVHQIHLTKCSLIEAKRMDLFLCVRPNVFTFYLRDENGNGHQVLCGADSAAELEDWCYQINKVINYCKDCQHHIAV